MVGRKQLKPKILFTGLIILCLAAGICVFPANAEYREFIIEGRDRRPIRGSFEYYDIYPKIDPFPFQGDRLQLKDEFIAREVSLVREPDFLGFSAYEDDYKEVVTGEPESRGYFVREHLYFILGFALIAIIAG